ncbi:hypothetical protein C475_06455 [Halosimplex carlsbadense 2-9-1]|uniref:Putative glutamine amidotransferase domain-containing protein n=1 Tax=Halosimplex carlsbadense 2-9-1 TaxID=797114 RepID=M0D092_9EURY|nr:glutamine amidotransferase [Halosimplex carlsbadense]ELZ27539.1 hypothetical protein C475_06455 [Halosimplex carlsbadense 2-9-1]
MDVLYIGDHKLQANEYYVGADSFKMFHQKIRDYEPLLETLEGATDLSVDFLDGPDTMTDFPRSVEELAEYDALIISDLSRGTLEPHFHPDSIPGPNLLRIVRDFVADGGGLVYCGGWMTFQGYQGVGNWHGTPVADTLPVDIRPIYDDRVERPEGASVTVERPDHPLLDSVEDESLPTIYGYNEVAGLRDDATEIATVDGNPLLAVTEHGEGRVVTYTSDPGIQWGLDLVDWDGYDEFWLDALEWATRQ